MKVYNFVYNYGFLSDWMKANPEIKRGEILQSMGMSDYGTLGKWIEGATMMPMAQMMKFCNRWCVPVTAFFLDEKAEDGDVSLLNRTSNLREVGLMQAEKQALKFAIHAQISTCRRVYLNMSTL